MSAPTGPPPGPDRPRPTAPPPDLTPAGSAPSGPPPATAPSSAAPVAPPPAAPARRRQWWIAGVIALVVAAAALIFVTGGSDDDNDKRTSGRSDLDSGGSCDVFDGVVSQADVERYLSGDAGGGTVNMVPAGLRRQVDSGTLGTCQYTYNGEPVTISLRRPSGDLTPTGSEEALGGLGDAAVYDKGSPRVSVLDRGRDVVLSVSYDAGFAVKTQLAMLAEFVLDRLPAHIAG